MDRAVLLALLTALLVTCSVAGTAVGGAPALHSTRPSGLAEPSPPAQVDDDRPPTDEILGLESPTRSDVTTQGVDVSTAVATQRASARAGVDRRALEVAFENAEDEQARRELLFQAATDVEIAISALHSEQRDGRGDYVNGTITTRDYVRSSAMASTRAEELRMNIELIRELTDRVPGFSMRSRVSSLEASLLTYRGPVSQRTMSATRGEEGESRVYIAVSQNGRTSATIEDGQYVREAFRSDLWTPDTAVLIGFDEVINRVEKLYPRFNTSEVSGGIATLGPDGTDLAPAGLYRVNIQDDGRTTSAYLDGDTRNVFFEVQRARLDSIEPGPSVSETENGTRLALNRTFDGGPLRIATYDNTTGTPTDLPLLVGDDRYRTGSDGVVWALAPEGRTDVVALGETGNVSVVATPVRPFRVDRVPAE